jgi:outer membrane protein assembly factor BamD (BamD/ComL family)
MMKSTLLVSLARRVVRPALLVCALFSATAVQVTSLSAQVTQADSAAVLLQAATEFERDGRWDVAAAIYQHITERFNNTPSARVAFQRLNAPTAQRIYRIS